MVADYPLLFPAKVRNAWTGGEGTEVGNMHTKSTKFGFACSNRATIDHYFAGDSVGQSFPKNEMSLTAWVKLDALPSTGGQTGCWYWTSSGAAANAYPWTDSNLYLGIGGSTRVNFGNSIVTLTNWHHVAMTTKPGAGGHKLYHNGRQYSTTGTGASSITISGRNLLRSSGGGYLNGTMCFVTIHNVALTAGEVRAFADPATTFDRYWRPRRSFISVAGAPPAGTWPQGPLGRPLHGALGGPI